MTLVYLAVVVAYLAISVAIIYRRYLVVSIERLHSSIPTNDVDRIASFGQFLKGESRGKEPLAVAIGWLVLLMIVPIAVFFFKEEFRMPNLPKVRSVVPSIPLGRYKRTVWYNNHTDRCWLCQVRGWESPEGVLQRIREEYLKHYAADIQMLGRDYYQHVARLCGRDSQIPE